MKRTLTILFVAAALAGLLAGQPAPAPAPAPPAQPAPPAPPARAVTPRIATGPGALYVGSGGYLGVGTAEVDAERAKELKLPEARGVEITRVVPGTAAEKAGLKERDVVLEYNGERVEGTEQFQRLVRETPPGRQVKLVVSRDGQPQTLTANVTGAQAFTYHMSQDFDNNMRKLQEQLGSMQWNLRMRDMPEPFMAWRAPALGIEAESLNSQLAEFFGVKSGVLVRSVTRDSTADKAGVKAGDVITKVDNEAVTTPSQVTSRMRSLQSKKTFPLTVVRNRQEVSLTVTLEPPQPAPEPRPRRIKVPRQEFRRGVVVSTRPLI